MRYLAPKHAGAAKAAGSMPGKASSKHAIVFIGAATTVHVGYLKPSAEALADGFTSITVVSERTSPDLARVERYLGRTWGRHCVHLLALDHVPEWRIESLSELGSVSIDVVAKIYGAAYIASALNIVKSLEKALQFRIAGDAFPGARLFLGENERAHYYFYRRVVKRTDGGATFTALTPSLRSSQRRMSSKYPDEALFLSDNKPSALRKVMRALTTPRLPSDPERFEDCNLQLSLVHTLPEVSKREIEAACRAGRACQGCKLHMFELVSEHILINLD